MPNDPAPQRQARTAASDDLSARIQGSGLIQPGSHPEFEKPTPGEQLASWFSKTFHMGAPNPAPASPPYNPMGDRGAQGKLYSMDKMTQALTKKGG